MNFWDILPIICVLLGFYGTYLLGKKEKEKKGWLVFMIAIILSSIWIISISKYILTIPNVIYFFIYLKNFQKC